MSHRAEIEEKYSTITLRFEIDEIAKTKEKVHFISNIFHIIRLFVIGLFGIFFAFLLGGFFRERKYIFEMISLFGLKSRKSYSMTLGEPILFSAIGVLL